MQKGVGVIYVLVGVVTIMIIAGGAYYLGTLKNQPQLQQSTSTSQTPQPTPTSVNSNPINSITVTGVLRTSGLTKEEKVDLNLNFSNYQITDFGLVSDNSRIMGYFLEIDDSQYKNLEGKCVELTGTIKPGWENLVNNQFQNNNKYTYERSAIILQNIKQLTYSTCNPYPGNYPGNRTIPESEVNNKRVFKGTLAREQRPAADISYDYQLNLTTPLTEEWGSVGGPIKITNVVIHPLNNSVWSILEDKMGKVVTVTGYKSWGYAESQYLLVTEIN